MLTLVSENEMQSDEFQGNESLDVSMYMVPNYLRYHSVTSIAAGWILSLQQLGGLQTE